jgi:hypothetical protein
VLSPDNLDEMILALRDTAEVPYRCQEQIWLTLVRRQAGEKGQQLPGSGDTEGEFFVKLGLAPRFVDGKAEIARRDALQLAFCSRHPRSLAGSPGVTAIIGDNSPLGKLIQRGRGAPQNAVSFAGRFITNDTLYAIS